MKICLLHPPHGAIGSRIPRENLPPLGLLAIGGPLIDDGHAVELLNVDLEPMSDAAILAAVLKSAPAPLIADLDAYRIGWELIDHDDYSYWGGKKAVVLQFSRGCPHLCTYCGQRGFWTRWRHRDPEAFAREIARLVREEGGGASEPGR